MLHRFVLFGLLIGLVSAAAIAQPKPSPTPPPYGTRAGTEAAVNAYNQQVAVYEAVCAKPDATLADMDHAHEVLYSYREEALRAATIEAEQTTREIKDAQRKVEVQEAVYKKLAED